MAGGAKKDKKVAKVSNRTELLPGYTGGRVRVFRTTCCSECWLCSNKIHIYLIFYQVKIHLNQLMNLMKIKRYSASFIRSRRRLYLNQNTLKTN